MRLSRNRNWGHPELVKFLERFAPLAAKATGWMGILIGDMAQPRGGPLPFGHRGDYRAVFLAFRNRLS
jgi:penicillin-insensitive murein endopeptidase